MRPSAAGYDFIVVGAGIFGIYAALFLHRHGFRVLLIERENRPWQKASVVNQARLHFGYHYPRSIATAILADGHRERFLREHMALVNQRFQQFYGIDRLNSLTDAEQFVRFCDRIAIPARQVERNDLFVSDRLEAVFETTEHSFDPYLLRHSYLSQLKEAEVECRFGQTMMEAQADAGLWRVELRSNGGDIQTVEARGVINASYANINSVNHLFGMREVDVAHEISEIVLFKSERLAGVGLTVMDGPYFSLMPYGLTGLHSLTSVLYTHHALSIQNSAHFNCQHQRGDCTPDNLRVCTTCPARPKSNAMKMRAQMNQYVKPELDFFEYGSLFTVKTKLKSSFIDDARPTEVGILRKDPLFFSVFSGKVNSIYEIEAVLNHV